ncbi:MAG: hypothetical protein AB7O68_14815 [Pirellulales bacterium]
MNEQSMRRLQQTFDAIRLVPKEPASYQRLWRCYQRAYLSDEDLLRAVGAHGEPGTIKGVSEPLEAEDIERALCMPQTVGFEVINGDTALGFGIVRYAKRDRESRSAFRRYLFDEVLRGQPLQITSNDAQRRLEVALDGGNIMCSVEFVANRSPTIAVALLMAAYRYVVVDRLEADNASVVGKLLDGVRIGPHSNNEGNLAIKLLVEGMPSEKIGTIDEVRQLRATTAHLQFALYLGDCVRIRQNAEQWGIPLAASSV